MSISLYIYLEMNQFAQTDFNLQLFVKDQKKKKMGVHYPSEILRTYLVSIIKRQRKLDISVFDKYISTNFIQVHSILKFSVIDF